MMQILTSGRNGGRWRAAGGAGEAGGADEADVALRAAMETETVKGDLKAAIEQYQEARGLERSRDRR